jgi:hypothetical protein
VWCFNIPYALIGGPVRAAATRASAADSDGFLYSTASGTRDACIHTTTYATNTCVHTTRDSLVYTAANSTDACIYAATKPADG